MLASSCFRCHVAGQTMWGVDALNIQMPLPSAAAPRPGGDACIVCEDAEEADGTAADVAQSWWAVPNVRPALWRRFCKLSPFVTHLKIMPTGDVTSSSSLSPSSSCSSSHTCIRRTSLNRLDPVINRFTRWYYDWSNLCCTHHERYDGYNAYWR